MKTRRFCTRAAGFVLSALFLQLFSASLIASPSPATPKAAKRATAEPTSAVGRIEVSRIGLNAPILEGTDLDVLAKGVGHFPKTPQPGHDGNVGLAAHRDTFFFPLRYIQLGDEITLTTPEGSFRYRVHKTWIVTPKHIEVVAPTEEPSLTLVTCYPFNLRGVNAPKRFIVRASRIEVADAATMTSQVARAKDF
ncbi:MAG TPA: class D sortase [Candidatus Acidoferrales bacterium]|jgi:sortase A|nr:class D sortase [Candidatus Acidoferrales bacterium]